MAHPKLSAAVNRSLLAASAAALIAGPLAGASLAQTDGVLDPLTDLTCEEAKKTENKELIAEFCPAEEEPSESPLSKSVDEVTSTTEKTVKQVKETVKRVEETVAPKQEEEGEQNESGRNGGGGGGGGGTPDPTEILKEDPTTGGDGPTGGPTGGTEVENSGSNFTKVDENGGGGSKDARGADRKRTGTSTPAYSYNENGPFLPGMQSQSSLTLQPFAAPLVSVPPVYELPQIAQELFGTTTAASPEAPVAADAAATAATTSTAASPYSAAGYAATTADPTGWLAATATGLIMLVGAGHALNGGRKPGRAKA